ncbi:MAG: AAA family ATPase [Pseudomonadota bacterium]
MYEDFYGLREKPFNLTPDPRFLFLSESHRVALEHLLYGITQKEGFMLIVGDVGLGKTTLCRFLMEKLGEDTETALILNPQISEEELLAGILSEFGITSSETGKKGMVDRLNRFLLEKLASNRKVAVIVDEAQNLSLSVLEQIRLLSNLETEKEKLLQIILLGQPELQEKLKLPVLRQLNQRISIRCHLRPLGKNETLKYIEHRLMIAGSKGDIAFSKRAISLIFKRSKGIPRLVNLISDRALLGGYSKQTNHITPGIVKRAIESLGGEEVFPSGFPFPPFKRLGYLIFAFLLSLTLLVILSGRVTLELPFAVPLFKPGLSDDTKLKEITVPEIAAPPAGNSSAPSLPAGESIAGKIKQLEGTYSYSIRLASYPREESALLMAKELNQLGYEAYIMRVDIPGKGIWYRIFLGKFKSEDAAGKVLKELKGKGALREFLEAAVVENERHP